MAAPATAEAPPGDAESIEEAAGSLAKASTHEPVGHTGQGLWKHKGWQLPAYIQHVANDLIESGHPESQAVHMAVGIVQNWAAGHDGKGHKVKPETQAAAAKAVAEWEKLKGEAHASSAAKKVKEAAEQVSQDDLDELARRAAGRLVLCEGLLMTLTDTGANKAQRRRAVAAGLDLLEGSTRTTSKSWDGSASRFTDEQYQRSCLIDRGGDDPPKKRCSLPVREPDGTLNVNALSAAAGRLGSTQAPPDAKKRAAKALRRLYAQAGETPPDSLKNLTEGTIAGEVRSALLGKARIDSTIALSLREDAAGDAEEATDGEIGPRDGDDGPPNLRYSGGGPGPQCAHCDHYDDEGHCQLYGNWQVSPDELCDDFAPDPDEETESGELNEAEAKRDPSADTPGANLKCPKCDTVQSARHRHCSNCGHALGEARKAKFAQEAAWSLMEQALDEEAGEPAGEEAGEAPDVEATEENTEDDFGRGVGYFGPALVWQRVLSSQGYKPGKADGHFGRRTEAATKQFQKDHGLKQDGRVARHTRHAAAGSHKGHKHDHPDPGRDEQGLAQLKEARSPASFEDRAWRESCALDRGQAFTDPKSRYRLPIRRPDGELDQGLVREAIAQLVESRVPGDVVSKRKAARKLIRACEEGGLEVTQGLREVAERQVPPPRRRRSTMTPSGGRRPPFRRGVDERARTNSSEEAPVQQQIENLEARLAEAVQTRQGAHSQHDTRTFTAARAREQELRRQLSEAKAKAKKDGDGSKADDAEDAKDGGKDEEAELVKKYMAKGMPRAMAVKAAKKKLQEGRERPT